MYRIRDGRFGDGLSVNKVGRDGLSNGRGRFDARWRRSADDRFGKGWRTHDRRDGTRIGRRVAESSTFLRT